MFSMVLREQPLHERRQFLATSASLCVIGIVGCNQMSIMDKVDSTSPLVTVEQGQLRGSSIGSINSFKRVPYAENPFTPTNRFKAPQPVAAWIGQRDACQFGPMPPQPSRVPGGGLDGEVDDLTLNVWASAGSHLAPVLVWFPGGVFYRVDASESWYDGSSFASHGIVVVTVNYRVGIDGFMAIDGMPNNRGLLDQVAALQWIQRNIAAFGGNADNVTIAGQSAGAECVMLLMGMPMARGLFHQAIAQSPPQDTLTPDQASRVANATSESLGCRPIAQSLAAIPLKELIAHEKKIIADLSQAKNWAMTSGQLPYSPVVDGLVLTARPIKALENIADKVPLLIGCTDEEWRLFLVSDGAIDRIALSDVELEARRNRLPSSAVELYAGARLDASPGDMLAALKSDSVFRIPTLRFAEQCIATGLPVWLYNFSWSSPGFGGRLGAGHVVDVPYCFNTLAVKEAEAVLGGPGYQPLADEMHARWIRFIRTGDPGWTRYDTTMRSTMRFDTISTIVDDPMADRRQLWSISHKSGTMPS